MFLAFEYIYNGSGVGVGDFNNDGLSDIFFGGNMVSSRMYLNRGDFKFEDVITLAGVETNLSCTGISLVPLRFVCVHLRSACVPDPFPAFSLLRMERFPDFLVPLY